jgi:putative membrane protein
MGGGPFGIGKFFMGFGPFGGLLSLLLFILVIYLLFKIVRSFIPTSKATSDKNDSLVILKNRLAKGEITKEEYSRMYEILKI